MMFGARGNPDEAECVRMIHAALDAGVNVIDAADIYSLGESETIVGKAIAAKRQEVMGCRSRAWRSASCWPTRA
jgi:aryl-alcohol dehydrogenase-like predicted oxidoreductase